MNVSNLPFYLQIPSLTHYHQPFASSSFFDNSSFKLTQSYVAITPEIGPVTCMDLERKQNRMFEFMKTLCLNMLFYRLVVGGGKGGINLVDTFQRKQCVRPTGKNSRFIIYSYFFFIYLFQAAYGLF